MYKIIIKDIDLAKNYDSGQVFSWERADGAYLVPVYSSLYLLKQLDGLRAEAQPLVLADKTEAELIRDFRTYFDIERDYSAIYSEIEEMQPELKSAVERARGIRLLKQDADEMLLTFIYSQNNHIPRIKKSMAGLKSTYGSIIGTYQGISIYDMPEFDRLLKLTEEDFTRLGAGYRAGYLVAAIEDMPALHEFFQRENLSSDEIMDRLLEIKGVGPKVAACIALFAHACWDAFPVDTWVKKALVYYYGDMALKPEFIREKIKGYGEYAALIQQIMFFHMREASKDERRTKGQ